MSSSQAPLAPHEYFKVLVDDLPPGEPLNSHRPACHRCSFTMKAAFKQGVEAARVALMTADPNHVVELRNSLIEVIFERERLAARKVPGRHHSVHVFRTIEAARRFIPAFRPNALGIYLVQHEGVIAHHSFMDWTTLTSINPTTDFERQVRDIQANGAAYWHGDDPPATAEPPYTETLLDPAVRVVRRVE